MTAVALDVRALTKSFGGVTAVDTLDLRVDVGETLGVIGPNGAGKSTLVGLVSGAHRPTSGGISLFGQDVSRLGPPERARLGIGRTYQIPRPFGQMTVLDNLLLAARHARGRSSGSVHGACAEILRDTGLDDVAHEQAGGLPLLRRKRLELARALALNPRVLLMDEIGAGLIASEIGELIDLIGVLKERVEAIIVIEHVMDVITRCCDRTAVLDFGKLVTEGPTDQVLADPKVAAIYLGAGGDAPVARPEPRPADGSRTPLLSLRNVSVHYGGVRALRRVDLDVGAGEAVALLGANGAGKTTLANAVSGTVPVDEGTITFDGARLAGSRPDQITARGIAQCMEGRRIFGTLSVEENLVLAAGRTARRERVRRLDEVYELFPVLADYRHRPGTAMSGGQQQMLAIGRALMSKPRLVVFDEISLGLAPVVVERLYEALREIRRTGVAMLLVEQNIERGLALADRAYVLSHGAVELSGTLDQIRGSRALHTLYVGESASDRPPSSPVRKSR